MNRPQHDPTDSRHPWARLAAAARRAPDGRDTTAPFGFATRVVALALERQRAAAVSLLERFALRALGLACLLACVSIAANYQTLSAETKTGASAYSDEEIIPIVDGAALLLDLTS